MVSQAPLTQAHGQLVVDTPGTGFTDLTSRVADWLRQNGCHDGILTVFLKHTSASLVIQENADPDVRTDLTSALQHLAPDDAGWIHTTEGPDDMPAHVKAMLTGVSIGIPVAGGQLTLGTWQGLYLIEHRTRPHRREVVLHFIGSVNRGP
jgi:secondary thiamine-phosphate synthase enzyme